MSEKKYKTTPVSGLYLLNPESFGAIVLDQQNVTGQFYRLGFTKVDPRWYLNIARRIVNIKYAAVVGNLAAYDVIADKQYYETAWLWDRYGFTCVHAPPKQIMLNDGSSDTDNGKYPMSDDHKPEITTSRTDASRYALKDMSDGAVRELIQLWSEVPQISHLLVGSHDVDFVRDVRQASWGRGKRITMLIVGGNGLAYQLKDAADVIVNVLDYAATYSADALDERGWWHEEESIKSKQRRIREWFKEQDIYPKYLENQFKDMDMLFQFMIRKSILPPGTHESAQQLSMGKIKLAMHYFMRWEKSNAYLENPEPPPEDLPFRSLRLHDPTMVPAQADACDRSLHRMINLFIKRGVLQYITDDNDVKLFYLNTDHPGVRTIIESSFL